MKQDNKKVTPKRLKGFQDLFDKPMNIKAKLLEKIALKAHSSGFQVMDTPCLEYAETLLGQDQETDKQVFKFCDNGKRNVALRFDLTVPFARFVAENHGKLQLPFKRYQYGKVWRAEKPQKGRYREFGQCDFDLIRLQSKWSDLEILNTFYSIFATIIKQDFTMKIGHRPLVSKITQFIYPNLSPENEERILINLDKLLKIGNDKVCSLIAEETNTPIEYSKKLVEVLSLNINKHDDFIKVRSFISNIDETLISYLEDLKLLKDFIIDSLPDNKIGTIDLDLRIVRGLGYYTGVVFETFLDSIPDFGSVCSGGRYDKLTNRFVDRELSGIGGSIGIDRLVAALSTLDISFMTENTSFFIAVSDNNSRKFAHKILNLLRNENICADISLKEQKLGQQFKYANKKGYTYVITIGEEETKQESISLKEMSSGREEKNIEINLIIPKIKSLFQR